MTHFSELLPVQSGPDDQLRLAAAVYLARYTGTSRDHTESDLRCYLTWCTGRGLDPLAARRPHLELYIRWMQEVRRFRPSTVSRRFSVVAGFYRTCVIDGVLEHSPAGNAPPRKTSRRQACINVLDLLAARALLPGSGLVGDC
jgi:site-specific recombinase XerD